MPQNKMSGLSRYQRRIVMRLYHGRRDAVIEHGIDSRYRLGGNVIRMDTIDKLAAEKILVPMTRCGRYMCVSGYGLNECVRREIERTERHVKARRKDNET